MLEERKRSTIRVLVLRECRKRVGGVPAEYPGSVKKSLREASQGVLDEY